jgi:hypothetical protein
MEDIMTGTVYFVPVPTRDTVRRLESKRWRRTARLIILRGLYPWLEKDDREEPVDEIPSNEETPPTRSVIL